MSIQELKAKLEGGQIFSALVATVDAAPKMEKAPKPEAPHL